MKDGRGDHADAMNKGVKNEREGRDSAVGSRCFQCGSPTIVNGVMRNEWGTVTSKK